LNWKRRTSRFAARCERTSGSSPAEHTQAGRCARTIRPPRCDENQQRIEGVFEELAAARPDTVSYVVLRLADDSFVHLSFHNHGEDEANPIASTAAFAHFQDGHADRREGAVDQQTAALVGAYVTTIG